MVDQTDLSYRFGFLLAKTEVQAPSPTWRGAPFGGFTIWLHPEAKALEFKTTNGSALLIGDAFPLRDKTVPELVDAYVGGDWDALDQMTGRFALISVTPAGARICHDPFGSRTIYYDLRGQAVGSHSSLVAEALNYPISQKAKAFIAEPAYVERGTSYLPGDATMYLNIKALIPNNYLDLGTWKTARYWPRRPIKPTEKADVMVEAKAYLLSLVDFFRNRYHPVIGLTAGVDTRAIVAAFSRSDVPTNLITWAGSWLPEKEIPLVNSMIDHLAMPHRYLPMSEGVDAIKESTPRATGYARNPSRLTSAMATVSEPTDVFIRGYGGEIMRGFYSRHKSPMTGDDLVDFCALYATKRAKGATKAFSDFVTSATAGFMERANYKDIHAEIDPRDIFYWEQRMGAWGANMLNEMDPALYSFVGLNSRPLYETCLGLPPSYRIGSQLMIDITAEFDPVFADIGQLS